MFRLIPKHRRHRSTNEVSGRGLYLGPHQQHRRNKTVYRNAVWQRSTPQALARTTQHQGQHHHQRKPESSRQEHQAGGVDGKSPTAVISLLDQEKMLRGNSPAPETPRREAAWPHRSALADRPKVTRQSNSGKPSYRDGLPRRSRCAGQRLFLQGAGVGEQFHLVIGRAQRDQRRRTVRPGHV